MTPDGVKHFAVLGDPIAHSKSPAMHAAAYRALGMPHTYEAIQARAADLPALVQKLRDGAFDGFNVTVPHKRAILECVDHVAPSAAAVEAANTLVRSASGAITAHNTDVPALAQEIARLAPEIRDGTPRHALVLGAGGASRGAMAALGQLGVRQITVCARSGGHTPLAPDEARERGVFIVVQTTSAGMTGADNGDAIANAVAWRALSPRAVAYDVIYAPRETPFLRNAAARGLRHANGLGMLARQGALAFELWLGVPAPFDAMLAAIA